MYAWEAVYGSHELLRPPQGFLTLRRLSPALQQEKFIIQLSSQQTTPSDWRPAQLLYVGVQGGERPGGLLEAGSFPPLFPSPAEADISLLSPWTNFLVEKKKTADAPGPRTDFSGDIHIISYIYIYI